MRLMAAQAAASRLPTSSLVLRWTTLFYLGGMVALPIVALGVQAAQPGLVAFWRASPIPSPGILSSSPS